MIWEAPRPLCASGLMNSDMLSHLQWLHLQEKLSLSNGSGKTAWTGIWNDYILNLWGSRRVFDTSTDDWACSRPCEHCLEWWLFCCTIRADCQIQVACQKRMKAANYRHSLMQSSSRQGCASPLRFVGKTGNAQRALSVESEGSRHKPWNYHSWDSASGYSKQCPKPGYTSN